MDIDKLTLGDIKSLQRMFSNTQGDTGLNAFIGKKVIVRTDSAGVHYGLLVEKAGNEVILQNSRRLYYWKTANNGISLSEVANAGLHKDSKVCAVVTSFWTEAIEIIPCTDEAIKSIEEKNEYKA